MTALRPRLFLVVDGPAAGDTGAALAAALAAGDVAAVLLPRPADPGAPGDPGGAGACGSLAGLVQGFGAAALLPAVAADEVAPFCDQFGVDGVHVEGDIALAGRCLAARGEAIVGAGGFRSRHDAMVAAEAGADYLSFGRLDRADGFDEPHPRSLEEAAWWAETFETPAVVHGGGTLSALEAAVATGAEFIAYGRAVFAHPEGPAAAVRAVNAALDRLQE